MATDAANDLNKTEPPDDEKKPKSWLDELLGAATAIIKSSGAYLGALAITVTTLFWLWAKFGLFEAYGRLGVVAFVAILAAPIVIAFATHTLPQLRDRKRMQRLREEGISGAAVPPGYFRLRPYDVRDHDGFKRADGAHLEIVDWISLAKAPLLYLTGRSGTGKSSLLAAWVLPELGFATVSARSFGDPIKALRGALQAPGAIWDRRPPKDTAMRALLEKAAKKVEPKRLLVLLDQFEEFLILHKPDDRQAMEALLKSLIAEPIEGLTILIVLRSDYIKELSKLDTPALREDENWFEVGPFTRADTRDFLVGSNLQVSDDMLESILDEAGEIEDNPGLIRPITANMLGVVLERFRGGLTKGTQPGSLLRDYLKEAIGQPDIADHAPTILEGMISDAGTKSPKSQADLAEDTKLDEDLVRGCLVQLGRPGLVRELDPDAKIWEVAHDFVARLLGQLVARAKPRLLTRLRPVLAPTSLAVWLLLLFGAYPAYQAYQFNATQRVLNEESVAVSLDSEGGHRLDYTYAKQGAIMRTAPYLGPLEPIHELDLYVRSDLEQLPSLDQFANLKSLSIGVEQFRGWASKLASLPPLEGLAGLETLRIGGNAQLVALVLPSDTDLKRLWIIWNNDLEMIDGLHELAALEEIDLRSGDDELLKMAIEQLKSPVHLKHVTLPFRAKRQGLGEVLNAKRRDAGRKEVQVGYR